MALSGQIFAERKPAVLEKKRGVAKKLADFSEITCMEYGTLPQEVIMKLGLRYVSVASVVSKEGRGLVDVYRAEVLENGQWRTVYVCESDDDADEGWHKYRL